MKMKKINKNKKGEFARFFLLIFVSVFLIFTFYFVGVWVHLAINGEKTDRGFGYNQVLPGKHFSNCSVKYEKCLDPDCGLYVFCNDKAYSECKVYDCGDYYGIATKLDDEGYFFVEEEKPDSKKSAERKKACRGDMEILESSCEEGVTVIKANLSTGDTCPLKRFVLNFNEVKNKEGNFIVENDNYIIKSDFCGELKEVIAIGSGGIVIARVGL